MTQDPARPTPASEALPGRRASASRRRVEATAVAAVLVPLLVLGALLLVDDPDDGAPGAVAPGAALPVGGPAEAPLSAVDLGCPSGVGADGRPVLGPRVRVGSAGTSSEGAAEETAGDAPDGGSARLDVLDGASRELDLSAGPVQARAGQQAAVVRGRGGLAPGLLALRSGGAAAVPCPAPEPERWFTAVGAGATHASVLELVNPDGGPAVADVTVLGSTGVVDVPALRGVTVPGGEAVRLDLAEVAPRRDDLALRVDVSRGRLSATLLDRVDLLLGSGAAQQDWLAAQDAPATELVLPGLVGGPGERALVLANPGEDEARVEVQVVTAESTITPVGLEPEVVPPGSVAVLDVSDVVRAEVRGGAVALRVSATRPVTATLRQVVGDDLAHAVAAPALDAASTLLPPGRARVALAGATAPARVVVRPYAADGRRLRTLRRELEPDRGLAVELPRRAVRVDVAVEGSTASGAVEVLTGEPAGGAGPDGSVVLPLLPLVDRALVPRVAPGLP